jgi:hypothetical protein
VLFFYRYMLSPFLIASFPNHGQYFVVKSESKAPKIYLMQQKLHQFLFCKKAGTAFRYVTQFQELCCCQRRRNSFI